MTQPSTDRGASGIQVSVLGLSGCFNPTLCTFLLMNSEFKPHPWIAVPEIDPAESFFHAFPRCSFCLEFSAIWTLMNSNLNFEGQLKCFPSEQPWLSLF